MDLRGGSAFWWHEMARMTKESAEAGMANDIRDKIVKTLEVWASERLVEADLYTQADAILSIPEISEALRIKKDYDAARLGHTT